MENEILTNEEKFEQFNNYLKDKQYSKLKRELSELYEPDIAEFLQLVYERGGFDDALRTFRLLPKGIGADVFSYMEYDLQEDLVRKLSDAEVHTIIEDLSYDDAVDILEEMPANVAHRIIANSTAETRNTINKLLQYEDDTAGAIMTTEYIDLKIDATVDDAFRRIRKLAKNSEQVNTCYVIDKGRVLKGVISIRDLILADHDDLINSVMEENVIYAETSTDQETLAHIFQKYDVLTVPIVDKEQRLVGIVTVDDIIDIIAEETTEDISKMAGIVTPDKPYLKTSSYKLWLARVPWLLLLMISSTFTGIIINSFEEALANALLFACVPMLMGTGGNAGGQSSVTVIRGMSLNEVEGRDFFKVLWKEIRVGLLSAITLAVVCFLKLQLIDNLIFGYDYDYITSFVVSITLASTVVLAKLVGALLPFLAKLLRLDPAVVASPFITTIIDVICLLLFVMFSVLLLK